MLKKFRREVLYYMSGNSLGFDPYEMLSPKRIGPWGGWIASPIQLLLFMVRSLIFYVSHSLRSGTRIFTY